MEGLTAIELWMLACILFVFASLVVYAVVLYLKQKKSLDASQPCECEVGKQSQATTWQSLKISSNFLCNFYPLCIF